MVQMQQHKSLLIDRLNLVTVKLRSTQDTGGENTPQESMFQMRIVISSAGRTLTTNMLNV